MFRKPKPPGAALNDPRYQRNKATHDADVIRYKMVQRVKREQAAKKAAAAKAAKDQKAAQKRQREEQRKIRREMGKANAATRKARKGK
jgi:hypothetical protein